MIEPLQRYLKTAAAVKVGVENNFMSSLIVTRHIFWERPLLRSNTEFPDLYRCSGLYRVPVRLMSGALLGI